MILDTRSAPPFFKNGYLLACERSRVGILVDPGDEIDDLIAAAASRGVKIERILLTHAHVDHVSGLGAARRATGAPIAVHRDDLFLYEAAPEHGRFFGYVVEQPPPPDTFYTPDARYRVGGYDVTVLHTPGHSPGGVCLAIGPADSPATDILTGDTLFAGSIGRTDLPGGDYATLLRSIRGVLLAFPDDTAIHPGHGPSSTIGAERRSNPFLRERN